MEKARSSGVRPVGAVITRQLPRVFQIACQLGEMERQWDTIAGPQLASRTQPLRLERGVLIVACDTPAAAQRVNMSGGTLIMRVRRLVGLELPGVRAIVRRPEKHVRRSVPAPRKITVPQKAVDEALAEAGRTIRDPELALAFARAEAAAKTRYGSGRKRPPV